MPTLQRARVKGQVCAMWYTYPKPHNTDLTPVEHDLPQPVAAQKVTSRTKDGRIEPPRFSPSRGDINELLLVCIKAEGSATEGTTQLWHVRAPRGCDRLARRGWRARTRCPARPRVASPNGPTVPRTPRRAL